MATQTPAQQNPTILIKEIKDQYLRKNFQNMSDYFSGQNQFLNFKFFEITISAATDSGLLAHGLGVLPKDISVLFVSGPGQITFDLDSSDATNLSYSTSDAVYCRIFVGSYWGNQSSNAAPGKMIVGQAPTPVVLDFIAPTVQVFKADTGKYILPTTPRKPLYIRVIGCGAGGGGGGGDLGKVGGDTSFGGTLIVGKGGGPGGVNIVSGGVGGVATSTLTTNLKLIQGGSGSGSFPLFASGAPCGGPGGCNPFGGGGGGGTNSNVGQVGAPNTGGGGGGNGSGVGGTGSSGGGSGGYFDVIIKNPAASYNFVIGAAGIAGTSGANGAAGVIYVEEYYQ